MRFLLHAICLLILLDVAYADVPDNDFIVVESLLRMNDGDELVDSDANVARAVDRYLQQHVGQREFLNVVSELKLTDQSDKLLGFFEPEVDASLQVEAARLLITLGQTDLVKEQIGRGDALSVSITEALGLINHPRAIAILKPIVTGDGPTSVRIAAAGALGRGRAGQKYLVSLHQNGELPIPCRFVVYNSLLNSRTDEYRDVAAELAPPPSTTGEPLPAISKLLQMKGNKRAGKVTFNDKGTCSKCHKVHGEGKDVGPDLTEIGSKLSREAMYTAILNPNAGISHNYEQYGIVTVDGLVLNGLLINNNDDEVTIKTSEGIERKIATDDIEEMIQRDVSLMPENLHQLMSVQELVNLVDYLVQLKKEAPKRRAVVNDKKSEVIEAESRDVADAIAGLGVADGLAIKLFSAEPELRNPSNIDVDHLGRLWVCEVVNYRHFRNPNNPVRTEGDRILVLEDTDGDGAADKETVFHQGTDINSAHGICVLGDRVIVSAGDSVYSFYDEDGDLVADRKEVMYTGIGGVEHDHGIHAFVPGPDGKLYFNFGNEGHQIKDANGKRIIDQSGHEVRDHGNPYQQGMVFRCDLDGSNLETLAWNFRNNWEVCVDSFGTMWQSDNDDDGNRGTRINYVMQYGNFGYRGELDQSTWRVPRTGMHAEIPLRHWHLRDPGVVPNVVQTGAGSPTGIIRYEGEALPPKYRGQLIHCDPGPNSVRTYELHDDGAGYVGHQVEILSGVRDQWFRPVDVCVAPDGSLLIADWYDPGVGGHRMGDTERGRVFRLTVAGAESEYRFAKPDLETTKGAIEALKSPNVATRFLAAEKLRSEGHDGETDLIEFVQESGNPVFRARAFWVLASFNPQKAFALASADSDSNIRCVAIRIASQSEMNMVDIALRSVSDPSAQVRREAVLSLRGLGDAMASTWAEYALKHDGTDRWYLEALGIAADGNWDACMEAWESAVDDAWDTPAGRDLIWRSRATSSSELIANVLVHSNDRSDSARYLRALDFQPEGDNKQAALKSIAVQVASYFD